MRLHRARNSPPAAPTGDGSTGSDSPTGSTVCWTVSDTTNRAHWSACTAAVDSTALDGASGDAVQHGGAGGGDGSAGNIRVTSATPLAGMQISPPAIALAT